MKAKIKTKENFFSLNGKWLTVVSTSRKKVTCKYRYKGRNMIIEFDYDEIELMSHQ